MTLREFVSLADDPLEASFMIASFLRTVVQGEPSTYEGECATIRKAMEILPFDLTTMEGIQQWLDDLGRLSDINCPNEFWLSMCNSEDADEVNDNQ